MTMKQIAIYGGFFVAVLAAALLAAGVLQHRVLARPRGQEPARAGQGGAVADAHGKKGEVSTETKAGQPGGPPEGKRPGKPADETSRAKA
jgi:hypothetical protein